MRMLSLATAALMLLTACGEDLPDSDGGPAGTPTPAPTATASAAATAQAEPKGARAVSEETDLFLFQYSYPAEAGNIAELAALLDRRLDRARARLSAQAEEGREAARDNGFPYNKYSNEVTWEVVADTPLYLSLSADISSYSGGAHGNYGFDSLVWDKLAKVAREPMAFFESSEALDSALAEEFCDALNAEREKRRGAPVVPVEDDTGFNECVDLDETTVLLGSTRGRAFDRIGVQIGPYVAGPYAEGAFEFTFPVDAEVLEAVKEEYREAFASRN